MSKRSLLWLTFFVGGFLVGLWLLLQPQVVWPFRLFWLALGTVGVGLILFLEFKPRPMSPQQLQEQGFGQIVAQLDSSTYPVSPALFAKKTPDNITRMERPRYFLAPPLPVNNMIEILEQCMQLSQRALLASEQKRRDQPLILATYRGQGAYTKIQRVIASLDVWGCTSWSDRLRKTPPPEPHPTKGYHGDPAFLALARELQEYLRTHPLPEDPFALLGIPHALDREAFDTLQQQSLTPSQLEVLHRLHTLFVAGETAFQKSLAPESQDPSPASS